MEQRKTPRRMHRVLNLEFLSGWSWRKLDTKQFFFIRAWENGRRWAEILTDYGLGSSELSSFLDMCRDPKLLGWNFAFQNLSGTILATQWRKLFNNPLFAKLHYRFKQEEEIGRVTHLLSELVCDFFIKVLPKWVS